jgi:hypothetical protein
MLAQDGLIAGGCVAYRDTHIRFYALKGAQKYRRYVCIEQDKRQGIEQDKRQPPLDGRDQHKIGKSFLSLKRCKLSFLELEKITGVFVDTQND